MILAFKNLSECTFTNQLDQLKAIANLIAGNDTIVAFLIIEAIVDQSFKLGWRILLIRFSQVEYLFVLDNFALLMNGEELFGL